MFTLNKYSQMNVNQHKQTQTNTNKHQQIDTFEIEHEHVRMNKNDTVCLHSLR